jgi:hypothetical protein
MSVPPIDIQAIATARYEEAWRQWFVGAKDADLSSRQAEYIRVAESADDLARTLQYRFSIEVARQADEPTAPDSKPQSL